jgi:hypothetical protein
MGFPPLYSASVSRWGQNALIAATRSVETPAGTKNLLQTGSSSAFLTHFLVSADDFNRRRSPVPNASGALKRSAGTKNLLQTGSSSAFLTHFLVSADDFNRRRDIEGDTL